MFASHNRLPPTFPLPKIHVGVAMRMQLYHATDSVCAGLIKQENRFKCGTHGFAGGAIYFSERANAACRKFRNGQGNPDVVILCSVNLGRCIVAEKREMSREACEAQGCDSVKILNLDVYAVYDPSRIEIVSFQDLRAAAAPVPHSPHDEEAERRQEEARHQAWERMYEEAWGPGRLLGGAQSRSGGAPANNAEALRQARLRRFGASVPAVTTPASPAPSTPLLNNAPPCTPSPNNGPAENVPRIPVDSATGTALTSSPGLHRVEPREETTTENAEMEMSEPSLPSEQIATLDVGEDVPEPSTPNVVAPDHGDEDEELQRALLLSMEQRNHAPADAVDEDLERAIMLSWQVPQTAADEDLERAIMLSLQ